MVGFELFTVMLADSTPRVNWWFGVLGIQVGDNEYHFLYIESSENVWKIDILFLRTPYLWFTKYLRDISNIFEE